MSVRRTQILPMAESAIRNALREAVRDALREVSLEREAQVSMAALREPKVQAEVGARFASQSDEEAWERFDSIRFARLASMSHKHAS
jgi:hypothetical protein